MQEQEADIEWQYTTPIKDQWRSSSQEHRRHVFQELQLESKMHGK